MTNRSYLRAIVHFDADSFFASVEQVMNASLRGKAVITGGERGAATSVSIEGKRRGLYRGMTLREMKRLCPDLVIVSSDYTSYSIFAKRMYAIAREFTPLVEEYSIDECFADITDLEKSFNLSYEEIAQQIQQRLHQNLGITFGVGLGTSKTMAKIASKLNKPAGFAAIPLYGINDVLKDIPVGNLWGLGFRTSVRMEKLGVHTALDFAQKPDGWFKEHAIAKPYRDIWLELNGAFVRPLALGSETHGTHSMPGLEDADGSGRSGVMGSILQSRTITPTTDRAVLLSALAKNIEGACTKARRHGVQAASCRFYLKTQDFTYAAKNLSLTIPLNDPREFLQLVQDHFDSVYAPGTLYRATGFGLHAITPLRAVMPDLFGESTRLAAASPVLAAMDSLNKKYGKETIHLGASLNAVIREDTKQQERRRRSRARLALGIDHKKKTINLPYLGMAR